MFNMTQTGWDREALQAINQSNLEKRLCICTNVPMNSNLCKSVRGLQFTVEKRESSYGPTHRSPSPPSPPSPPKSLTFFPLMSLLLTLLRPLPSNEIFIAAQTFPIIKRLPSK
ncbi:uncharacterized protein EAE97_003557 [Botrytis byssoidea]|uniref:Uncharacterized protein n=1 Tax=Botrytis byssoidea TaxID=139641 RepID=A0A9P5IUM2_9HELO|nr:uncharacterized protein EAE97_003557 [Botrytis byssoidea]KAF7948146.1 hypothetical protein EAE97_003557 [Botrytis byssoidea]